MSDKSLFYRGFEGNTEIEDFFERFQEYAEANETGNSVYILKRPLGDKKYTYDYDKAVAILVPKHKMLFLDYGGNEEAFEEYVDDFVDDVVRENLLFPCLQEALMTLKRLVLLIRRQYLRR